MSTTTSGTGPSVAALSSKDRSLRARAVPIFLLVIGEILVGNELAEAGSPYPLGYLAAHIALAIVLVAFSVHVLIRAVRLPSMPARAAAGVTFVSALGAALGGTVYLFAGSSAYALDAMEAFGGVALLGSVLLILWGSVSVPAAPVPSQAPR